MGEESALAHTPRPTQPLSGRPPLCVAPNAPLGALLREIAELFLSLKLAAAQLHGPGAFSAARRSFLRDLAARGAQTIPQMARARLMSRQGCQRLANALADDGLIEFIDNPAHKRSRLVRLTPSGKRLVDSIDRRELETLAQFDVGIPEDQLLKASETLRCVRLRFEGQEWIERVRDSTVADR